MGDEVLCIGLLGVFSISAGDSVIADDAWRLRKAKTLIKLLALASERRDSLDQLRIALQAELVDLERDSEPRRAGAGRPELPSQLTSFVGRERELAEAATLLRDINFLSAEGEGGCSPPTERRSSTGCGGSRTATTRPTCSI